MKTKREITMQFGKGGLVATITIPSGTRVVPADHGEFFVDDLSWIDSKTQGMTLHDATYYGIRIAAADVITIAGISILVVDKPEL